MDQQLRGHWKSSLLHGIPYLSYRNADNCTSHCREDISFLLIQGQANSGRLFLGHFAPFLHIIDIFHITKRFHHAFEHVLLPTCPVTTINFNLIFVI